MKQEFDLTGSLVAISVPSYKGHVPLEWLCAFTATQSLMLQHGVKSYLQARMNSGLIHCERNLLVHEALKNKDVTHIMFIDDDVVWKPDDAMRLIAFGQKYPFVCGVYPARKEPIKFMVHLKDDNGKIIKNDEQLLQAIGVPAGFCMLKREVFENPAMKAQSPVTIPTEGDQKGELVYGYFDFMHEGLTGAGEDISFCRRWLRAGGDIWVDPAITLQHYGAKAYSKSYVDYLNERQHAVQ